MGELVVLSVADACKQYGVKKSVLDSLEKDGKIEITRYCGKQFVRICDLKKLKDSGGFTKKAENIGTDNSSKISYGENISKVLSSCGLDCEQIRGRKFIPQDKLDEIKELLGEQYNTFLEIWNKKHDARLLYRRENEGKKKERKSYNEAHKEEIKAYKKAYRESHKEEIKAYKKAYQEYHKEDLRAKANAYREAHREEKNAYLKAYHEAHKEEENAKARARYAAKKAGIK